MEVAILLLGLIMGGLCAGKGSGGVSLDGRVIATPEEVTRCYRAIKSQGDSGKGSVDGFDCHYRQGY